MDGVENTYRMADNRLDNSRFQNQEAVYEEPRHPIRAASGARLPRHLMEAKGVTQTQLHQDMGLANRGRGISEVLARKIPFSQRMIGTLARYFHVPPSVLAANIGTQQAGERGHRWRSGLIDGERRAPRECTYWPSSGRSGGAGGG